MLGQPLGAAGLALAALSPDLGRARLVDHASEHDAEPAQSGPGVILATLMAAFIFTQRACASLAHRHLGMLGLTVQARYAAQVLMPHGLVTGGQVALAHRAAIRPTQPELP